MPFDEQSEPALLLVDTHPTIRKRQIEGYREMSVGAKLNCIGRMYQFGVRLAVADVRRLHPDLDERECRLRAASRWIGPELMRKAYGWTQAEED